MTLDETVESFCAATRREASVEVLADAFDAHIKKLGFDEFAAVSLCHEQERRPDDAVWIMRYREDWTESYFHNKYYRVDPVFHAARRERLPFVWRDYLRDRRLDKAQEYMLAEARELGHLYGMTVPIPAQNGMPGCVSLCAERAFDPGAAHTAHIMALHLFARARELVAGQVAVVAAPAELPLSLRERECLTWAASGKTAWEISRILSLSEFTVREYLQQVRRKFGVKTTVQAIAHAVRHDLIMP